MKTKLVPMQIYVKIDVFQIDIARCGIVLYLWLFLLRLLANQKTFITVQNIVTAFWILVKAKILRVPNDKQKKIQRQSEPSDYCVRTEILVRQVNEWLHKGSIGERARKYILLAPGSKQNISRIYPERKTLVNKIKGSFSNHQQPSRIILTPTQHGHRHLKRT